MAYRDVRLRSSRHRHNPRKAAVTGCVLLFLGSGEAIAGPSVAAARRRRLGGTSYL